MTNRLTWEADGACRLEIDATSRSDMADKLIAWLRDLRPAPAPEPTRRRGVTGERNAMTTRTDAEVEALLRRVLVDGVPAYRVAEEAGVNAGWLYRVKNGQVWPHIRARVLGEP